LETAAFCYQGRPNRSISFGGKFGCLQPNCPRQVSCYSLIPNLLSSTESGVIVVMYRFVSILMAAMLLLMCGCALSTSHGPRFSAGGVVISAPVTSAKEIKWHNVSRQGLDISCGPAALATIINYYIGDSVSEMEIISHMLRTSDMTKIKKIRDRQAFSLLDLKRYAEARGYRAAGYRLSIHDLTALGKPAIIPIETLGYRHFVVFKGVKGDRVYLADPAFGNTTMRYPHFLYIWKQRVALVMDGYADDNPLENHGLSVAGIKGDFVDGSIYHLLNPSSFYTYSPNNSF
jgi:predicted double-glycine peptidase